jgi:hypothetical protein
MSYDFEGKARDILASLPWCGPQVRGSFLAAALHHAHEEGRKCEREALERRIENARGLHPRECRCAICAALDCPFGDPGHYGRLCPRCDGAPEDRSPRAENQGDLPAV